MLDSAIVLNGGGFPPSPIEAMESFVAIETFGTNSVVVTGFRMDNSPLINDTFYFFGPVTRVIDINTLDSLYSNYTPWDVLFNEIPHSLDGPKLFTSSESGVDSYISLAPEIPQTTLISKGSYDQVEWQEDFQDLFLVFDSDYGRAINLHLAEFIQVDGKIIASSTMSDWGQDEFEPLGEHIVEFDENFLINSINRIYIGEIDEADGVNAFCKDSQGRYFLSGVRDVEYPEQPQYLGMLPLWDNEPESFYIARIDSLGGQVDFGEISGTVFLDNDGDGIQDMNESGIPNVRVNVNGNYAGYTNSSGDYQVFLEDTGSYTLTISPVYIDESDYAITSTYPAILDVTQTQLGLYGANFGIEITNEPPLNANVYGWSANPGFEFNLWQNIDAVFPEGFDSLNCALTYEGSDLSFVNSSHSMLNDSGSELQWTILSDTDQVIVNEHDHVRFLADVDATGTLFFSFTTTAYYAGQTIVSTDNHSIVLTGSYDPNDKLAEPAGIGPEGSIPMDTERLTYTIRFQNTGTDTTHFIRIHDAIDTSFLDLTGFQMLGSSHADYEINYIGNEIHWNFDPIYLPDSSTNPVESQGFIRFSIPIRDDVSNGDQILNRASIYFDFNDAIVTPDALSSMYACPEVEIIAQTSYCQGEQLMANGPFVVGTSLWTFDSQELGNLQEAPMIDLSNTGEFWLHLTVQDSVCNTTNMDSILIQILALPDTPEIAQNGNILSTSSGFDLQWYLNGIAIPGAQKTNLAINENGIYTVEASSGECSSISSGYNATLSGLTDLIASEEIELKMTDQSINLAWSSELNLHQIRLVDIQGRELGVYPAQGRTTLSIEKQNLSMGIYILIYDAKNEIIGMSKVAVE